MNFNNPRPSDDIIERELHALRQPAPSDNSLGAAILAMQAPTPKTRISLKGSLGFGSAVVAAGALVVAISISTGPAHATELRAIAAAQENQPLKHMKATMFDRAGNPTLITQLWLDHNKEAFRQYRPNGNLEVATLNDGKLRYHYSPANSNVREWAIVDEHRGVNFTIDSIDSLLDSEFFKSRPIEKKAGIQWQGKTCDYYSFAKGFYRVWVDPKTKLPLQREIYDRGVTLVERDVYTYPAAFAPETFEPYRVPGVKYFDFPACRNQLEAKLLAPGQSQRVGSVTLTLHAVVTDPNTVVPLWTSTGGKAPRSGQPNVQIEGLSPAMGDPLEVNAIPGAVSLQLHNESLLIKPPKTPYQLRIGAWTKQGEFQGWATFSIRSTTDSPSASKLLSLPTLGVATAKAATANQ